MKILVLLNGCGHRDGSEIHEAVLTLTHIETHGCSYHCCALDENQQTTIDHLAPHSPMNTARNMLRESARIARGQILDLTSVDPNNYDALIIPGGNGTAYNLCNFATAQNHMTVHHQVEKIICDMYEQKKPIGAICIAPVLVAKVLANKGVKVTIGNDPSTAKAINSWGAIHEQCAKDQCITDHTNKIVTTPAYMYGESTLSEVSTGIEKLVIELTKFIQ